MQEEVPQGISSPPMATTGRVVKREKNKVPERTSNLHILYSVTHFEPVDQTAELFAKWAEEDAQMTPEEIEAEDAAIAEIEAARQPGVFLRDATL